VPAKYRSQVERQISVKAVVQPEIDAKKLARAYVNLAIDLERTGRLDSEGAGEEPHSHRAA
jgi:hypothetical protein